MGMKVDHGDKNSAKIWLLGDSNPVNWEDKLDYPLDPRHPAVHNIWTPVIDEIQKNIYINSNKRVDVSKFYIRNAVEHCTDKPNENSADWNLEENKNLESKLKDLNSLLSKHNPMIMFTFGRFSYEFARRSLEYHNKYACRHWNTIKLGDEFRKSIRDFSCDKLNIIPLLHATIARNKFLTAQTNFVSEPFEKLNYFEYTGKNISNIILKSMINDDIWV